MEKYSVLMSVYHKEKVEYFKESVDSMLNQTAFPDEIVIVEDGPLTEDLYSTIDTYLNKYPDVFTIVKLEQNKGLGAALNEGLKKCRNELVARMDTDDISLPDRCEKQLLKFESNPDLDIMSTQIDEFIDTPDNIVSTRIVPIKHEDICAFARRRSPFNHVAVMFKKSKVLQLGGYKAFGRQEDLELFVKMVNEGCKAANIDESLVLVRINADNFKRRTTWVNCGEYIEVMYGFYKKKYLGIFDLMYVVLGEFAMLMLPQTLTNALSNKFLRK